MIALIDSPTLSLLAMVVLAAISLGVIAYYRALQREEEEELPSDEELLADFQEARYAGEIDEAEFQRVSAVIKQRQQQKMAEDLAKSSRIPKSTPPAPEESDISHTAGQGELPEVP